MILFRPVGHAELLLIARTGYRAFPPRLAHQPIFYPVLTQEYARKIARDWNTVDEASGYAGFVLRFTIPDDFAQRYPVQIAGGKSHEELWVPAEELETFNQHIDGPIQVIERFYGPQFHGSVDPQTRLPTDVPPPPRSSCAPLPQLAAGLGALYRACVEARLLGHEGQAAGLSAERSRELADLMDAVHNIPFVLLHWDQCDESLLRDMLRDFDARWREGRVGLLEAYEQAMAKKTL
jgi:hypothetical protein